MLLALYFPVTCNPCRAVTLPKMGIAEYIGVPHRVTNPYPSPKSVPGKRPFNSELPRNRVLKRLFARTHIKRLIFHCNSAAILTFSVFHPKPAGSEIGDHATSTAQGFDRAAFAIRWMALPTFCTEHFLPKNPTLK